MEKRYKEGEQVFILESNRIVRECTIVKYTGSMYIIRFGNGGGIKVKPHRLFKSKEDAEKNIPTTKENRQRQGNRSPYEYMY